MMQPNAGNARSRGFAQDAGHTHTAPPRAATCSVGRRVSVAVLVAALALSALLSGGALGTPLALAQGDITPAAALERLLTAEALEAEWFTPEFLAELPLGQTQAIVRQITAGLGQLQAIEGSGMQYQAIFDNGVLPTQILLDGQGRIAGIFFSPPRPKVSGLEDALAPFHELPGQVSVIVMGNGAELAALNPDEPLGVGSAFKLAVLAILRHQIETGQRAWTDVVELEEAWLSLPSGLLQDWPVGSPFTLHTLAGLMISLSDNTATDALIHVLGRETIEAITPRNRPLLTTRELFMLKHVGNEDVLEQYRAADEAGRRAVLAAAADRSLPTPDLWTSPRALDVEWFFTTREMCTLMSVVYDLPLMSISPGPADPEDWAHVAFKGGSEPGVHNLTTAVVDEAGSYYCVSATWNNTEDLEQLRFYSLYSGLLEAIKGLGSEQK